MANKGLYAEVHCQVFVREEWDLDTATQFATGRVTGGGKEREGEGEKGSKKEV